MSILNQLKAEAILEGTGVIEKIAKLRSSLVYKTTSEAFSFDDYYHILLDQASKIEQIQLEASVPPGAAQKYLVDLTQALQLVTDKIELTHQKALFFSGKIQSAIHNRDNLAATFSAWYQIAAAEALKDEKIKITATTLKALAESEFSRILDDGGDIELNGMKDAVEVLIDHLKHAKKLALEKYKIGTEQANSSIIHMPSQGFVEGGQPFPILRQRYGMTDEATDKPKYDDEDEDGTEPEPTGSFSVTLNQESPDYVDHREIPKATPGMFKSVQAMVEVADLGEVTAEEILEGKLTLQPLPDVIAEALDLESDPPTDFGDSASVPDIEDDEVFTPPPPKRISDPFLGEVEVTADKVETVVSPTGKKRVFEDEDLEVPAPAKKSRPKYDDEEDEAEPTVTPEPETKPQPQKGRKKITFDDPF